MHSVGWKLKVVYMPFSLMVFNLGFWGGGLYNLLFPCLLLEYKNVFFVSWKVNFQFITHPRNCRTVFLKHGVLAHIKTFRNFFQKGCFELHLYNGAWSTILSMASQKQNLPLPGSHWWGPGGWAVFGVEVRNACEWHGYSIEYSRKRIFLKKAVKLLFFNCPGFLVFPTRFSPLPSWCL